jgi:transposase
VDDRELYQAILGLHEPWCVERVQVSEAEETVYVWVAAEAGTVLECPECRNPSPAYDHSERRWRHLDTCQFKTVLCARVPRVSCSVHGVKTVRVPWAEPGSRFTILFERLAISWLKEATPTAVARRLSLSWDEARGIQERAVRRGLARRTSAPVARIGIDEKSFLKRHQYVSVVVDLDERRVLHVADDRKADSLTSYFEGLTETERSSVEAIAMDMWEPYRKAIRMHIPNADAKIVFDKFHVLQHVGDAVDRVRKQEHRTLTAAGDTRLKGTKYDWLKNPRNFTNKTWREFKRLRESTLKTARAWALKESLVRLWEYKYVGAARTFFKRWYYWATHSQLEPMIRVARMLKRHLENILTYLTHRITNAVTEGLNAKIQWIKYGSRGFRAKEAFKMSILFHCGGLDLDPRFE